MKVRYLEKTTVKYLEEFIENYNFKRMDKESLLSVSTIEKKIKRTERLVIKSKEKDVEIDEELAGEQSHHPSVFEKSINCCLLRDTL